MNRIRITDSNRYNEPLTSDERTILVNKLQESKSLTIKQVKKHLNLVEANINLDLDKILGNNTYYEIKKIFGTDRFEEMTDDQRYAIWHTFHFAKDEEWLKNYAKDKWELDKDRIEQVLKAQFETKPNDGYAQLSHKALKKLIPYLEKGYRYDEAAKEAGYHHSDFRNLVEQTIFLPDPENVRNPIVQQSLYQLKKVVNTLIHEYGQPDIIRVELARELKASKDKREQLRKENKRRQQEYEKIRQRLINELGFSSPNRTDIIKYRLWEESNFQDPYSGDEIGLAELFSGKYEIEHIIPRSRSLDDSYLNKTLCRRDYNKTKGNQTPFEAFGHKDEFDLMIERVKKFKFDGRRNVKLDKFTTKEVDEELSQEFFNRQLNDTAYISRQAKKYLQHICPKTQVVKGGTTAKLRRFWGLNGILSNDIDIKTRDDHRHHAVDALVVANTTPYMLRKLSLYFKYKISDEKLMEDSRFPMPWDDFRKQSEERVNNILVSFHLRNRVRGQLHEETNYGQITDPENGQKVYVVRKPVESLTRKNIGNIVNKETRELVISHLEYAGIDLEKSGNKIPKDAFNNPIFHPKTGHPVKTVRVKIPATNMIPLYGKERKLFVEPGKNHHIEIFSSKDGKQKNGYVISLYESVRRKRAGEAIIRKELYDSEFPIFIMSLSANEMILLDEKNDETDISKLSMDELTNQLYRVQKITVTKIITLRHHTVTLSGESDPGVVRKIPNSLQAVKVRINPIGKIELIK